MSTQHDLPDYRQMLLAKTRDDKALALTMASQLFAELPEQLDAIQQALSARQYELARRAVHNLNGSLGVCGLENLRRHAHQLERCLVNKEFNAINRYWFQLQQGIFDFTQQQQALLSGLM